jgi:excisionase family DNA binding protein
MSATPTAESTALAPSIDWGPVPGPLAVKPRRACELLDVGLTRLYELLNAGEIVGYTDGRSRKIVVQSIHDYVRRRIEASVARPSQKAG